MTTTATQVKFRDDFSAALVGLIFEIDGDVSRDADGRELVGLRIKRGLRWAYRLAYVTDLRTVDGTPLKLDR